MLLTAALPLAIGCGGDDRADPADVPIASALASQTEARTDALDTTAADCAKLGTALAAGNTIFDAVPKLIAGGQGSGEAGTAAVASFKDAVGRWVARVNAAGAAVSDPTLRDAADQMEDGIEHSNAQIRDFSDLQRAGSLFDSGELNLANTKISAICGL